MSTVAADGKSAPVACYCNAFYAGPCMNARHPIHFQPVLNAASRTSAAYRTGLKIWSVSRENVRLDFKEIRKIVVANRCTLPIHWNLYLSRPHLKA